MSLYDGVADHSWSVEVKKNPPAPQLTARAGLTIIVFFDIYNKLNMLTIHLGIAPMASGQRHETIY